MTTGTARTDCPMGAYMQEVSKWVKECYTISVGKYADRHPLANFNGWRDKCADITELHFINIAIAPILVNVLLWLLKRGFYVTCKGGPCNKKVVGRR